MIIIITHKILRIEGKLSVYYYKYGNRSVPQSKLYQTSAKIAKVMAAIQIHRCRVCRVPLHFFTINPY